MTEDSRITDYIDSLSSGRGEALDAIASRARAGGIPIVKEETACLLEVLVAVKKPAAILEIGTAVGYSALLMGGVMPEGCHITTIERDERNIAAARKNISEAGKAKAITLVEGDAGKVLAYLAGPFDFIFMDAAKGQYVTWLPHLLRLLPLGGILVSDNVLQGGNVIQSRFAVARRDRTIHSRMREYLYALKHMDGLRTAVTAVGDGVAVSVRI